MARRFRTPLGDLRPTVVIAPTYNDDRSNREQQVLTAHVDGE